MYLSQVTIVISSVVPQDREELEWTLISCEITSYVSGSGGCNECEGSGVYALITVFGNCRLTINVINEGKRAKRRLLAHRRSRDHFGNVCILSADSEIHAQNTVCRDTKPVITCTHQRIRREGNGR